MVTTLQSNNEGIPSTRNCIFHTNTMHNAVADDDGAAINEQDNVLVLSLYLIHSEDDLLLRDAPSPRAAATGFGGRDVARRARLYRRLCRAAAVANAVLRDPSSPPDDGNGDVSSSARRRPRPWSSGGDGPAFGVHCDGAADDDAPRADADDSWQSGWQSGGTAPPGSAAARERAGGAASWSPPHLRAVCRYGHDVDDAWRCVSLALRISSQLAAMELTCAVECWDRHDGHVLLVEAAEVLPSWADDDVATGGAGGPGGCRHRCWIVDGRLALLPPTAEDGAGLSRETALQRLVAWTDTGGGAGAAAVTASEAVHRAILDRIDRADCSHVRRRNSDVPSDAAPSAPRGPRGSAPGTRGAHWHAAAAALPASVARFLEGHGHLAPLLVDAFCARAPTHARQERARRRRESGEAARPALRAEEGAAERRQTPLPQDPTGHAGDQQRLSTADTPAEARTLGASFPFERLVVVPVVLTRASYAELITGRGVVPSFPLPAAYRSVELNRLQRQLRRIAISDAEAGAPQNNGGDGREDNDARRRRHPFDRAVDVGARLCAGLEWILNGEATGAGTESTPSSATGPDEAAVLALNEVERRLRVFWTRIDAEACRGADDGTTAVALPWIEQAWQAGPNGIAALPHLVRDGPLLRQALEAMAKCPVFAPELSKPTWQEPCPCTRPAMSLREMARAGMERAARWQREAYREGQFPMPKAGEVDDDAWAEVHSLEELEEEMRRRSSTNVNAEAKLGRAAAEGRPRRTTRRSRRNLRTAPPDEDAEEPERREGKQPREAAQASSSRRVLEGVRAFLDGEGDLGGAVTRREALDDEAQEDKRSLERPEDAASGCAAPHAKSEGGAGGDRAERAADLEPATLMSREVNIDARKFLDVLHAALSNPDADPLSGTRGDSAAEQEDSKYFFQEDLDYEVGSDDSRSDGSEDAGAMYPRVNDHQACPDEDPWSLPSIMVRLRGAVP